MMAPAFFLSTLGCAKNQVDSEKVEAMLGEWRRVKVVGAFGPDREGKVEGNPN